MGANVSDLEAGFRRRAWLRSSIIQTGKLSATGSSSIFLQVILCIPLFKKTHVCSIYGGPPASSAGCYSSVSDWSYLRNKCLDGPI